MRSAIRLALTLGALVTAVILAACGGSSTPDNAPAAQGQVPAVEDSDTKNAPPAAAVEPTATPESLFDLTQLTPIPPEESPVGVDALLGATDRWATRIITDYLALSGFNLDGIEFFVFPLPDGEQNMLVLAMEAPIESAFGSDDVSFSGLEPMLRDLIASDAYAAANIGRVVVNARYLDEGGAVILIVTMTQSASTFTALLEESISDEEARAQTQLEIRWLEEP